MKRKYFPMSTRVCTSLLKWMIARRRRAITLRNQSSGTLGQVLPVLAPVRVKSRNNNA
ncbi:hypothetical protein BX591_103365 [Paraburkholderia bryophila]|uniref:Uncharacterized protein n=1 Tax=Paraburkholderia bryophila TaxID=420952 RepID=A0A329CV45_9BURK|nr:hypothetical protein BX591_103365 [Paraburkholderia bryophila]